MAEIRLPLSITYETEGVTPVADVIVALQSTEAIARDAVSLLPSLIDGLKIEKSSLNVRVLSQESPLKELFFISLFVVYQDELVAEVPPMLEELFNISTPEKYDTLVTVAFLAVAFYGAGLAIDAVKKAFSDSLPRQKYEELIAVLASETDKPAADIRAILDAKFGKPAAVKRVVLAAKNLFRPSQNDKNASVVFDRDRIPPEIIREIPYPGDSDKPYETENGMTMSAEVTAVFSAAQSRIASVPATRTLIDTISDADWADEAVADWTIGVGSDSVESADELDASDKEAVQVA